MEEDEEDESDVTVERRRPGMVVALGMRIGIVHIVYLGSRAA